jgi:hypothetical protein
MKAKVEPFNLPKTAPEAQLPSSVAHGPSPMAERETDDLGLCRRFVLRRRLLYGGPDGPGETEDDDGLQGQPF